MLTLYHSRWIEYPEKILYNFIISMILKFQDYHRWSQYFEEILNKHFHLCRLKSFQLLNIERWTEINENNEAFGYNKFHFIHYSLFAQRIAIKYKEVRSFNQYTGRRGTEINSGNINPGKYANNSRKCKKLIKFIFK